MDIRCRTRQMGACLTVFCLAFAMGGRFVLDLQSELGSRQTIEIEHGRDCPPFHDHLLCIQLLRSPWSSEPATASLSHVKATLSVELPDLAAVRPGGTPRLSVARSPPARS